MKHIKSMKPVGKIKFIGVINYLKDGSKEFVEPCKEAKIEVEKFLNKKK